MDTLLTKEEKDLLGSHYRPAVSIILPFDPKMSLKTEVDHRLKLAIEKVEKELMNNYPADLAMPVIKKLHRVVSKLNYNTHKKSIAIFVSPVAEKVLYLDQVVDERVVIDESFELRDLVFSKKQSAQYLLLTLSGKSSKMYLDTGERFSLLKSNVPQDIEAYERDLPERVANYSDPAQQKEILHRHFFHQMDVGLSQVLKAYPLPVLVLGVEKVLGQFRQLSKNKKNIVAYVHGNYEEASEQEIRHAVKPYLADWNELREQAILQQVDQAMSEKKLVFGVKEVWATATHKNGSLLVVEKDFVYAATHGSTADRIYEQDLTLNNPFYIKDAVDDIMEKVLDAGGDVEFVQNGALKEYGRIALIKFY